MAAKRKTLSRFFSSLTTSREEQEPPSSPTGQLTTKELEKRVHELSARCTELELKLKKEQNKCLDWKKQMINSILQKYETTASAKNEILSASEDFDNFENLGKSSTKNLSRFDFKHHPLLKPEIASYLMQFLKKEDLYRVRQVCTAWNVAARFSITSRIEAHIKLDSIEHLQKFQQIQQILGAKHNIFYHNFYFHYSPHHPAPNQTQITRTESIKHKIHVEYCNVLKIIGEHAKKLTLTFCDNDILQSTLTMNPSLETLILTIGVTLLATFSSPSSSNRAANLTTMIPQHLKKLKYLTIHLFWPKDSWSSTKYEDNFLAILKLLLSQSPNNLIKFHLLIHGSSLWIEGSTFGNHIAQLIIKAKLSKLNDLHLSYCPIDKKWLTELLVAGSKFEFKSLGLCVLDWRTCFELIPTLYTSNTKSVFKLRQLALRIYVGKNDSTNIDWLSNTNLEELIINAFRHLKSLAVLELSPSKYLTEGKYTIERLSSAQSHYLLKPLAGIPILKCIEAEPNYLFKDLKIDPSSSSPSSSPQLQHKLNKFKFVNSLVLRHEQSTNVDVGRKCVKLFYDSLKRLEFTPADSASLIIIWNGLTTLEELKIQPSESIPDFESVLVGIHSSDCKKLREDPTILLLMGMTDGGKVLRHLQSQPSIRQLRKLRSLDTGTEKYLSDISILFCFIKMKSLTALKFRFKGSYSSIRLLKAEQPGIYLDTWK